MSTNPISFRVGFESQIASMPPEHQQVIRTVWNAITDLQGAIPALKGQIDTNKSSIDTINNTVNTSTASENVSFATAGVSSFNANTGAVTFFPFLGTVNNQTGVTAYKTLQSDDGAVILFDDSSPIALTLSTQGSSPGIQLPWYSFVLNNGSGTVTVTPATGTINGSSSIAISSGNFVIIFFDGTNFEALLPASTGTVVTSLNGLNGALSLTSTGSTISITPSGSTIDLEVVGGSGYSLGGAVTAANVSLGLGAGTGATISLVSGLDGTHLVQILTGTTPHASAPIYTFTFTTSRGHITYPIAQSSITNDTSLNQTAYAAGGSATTYVLESNNVALNPTQSYLWTISAP